jgi:hypothetical protein
LPIKPGFRPYKQPPRKIYKDEVLADVKKEVERLIEANFVRPCRYAEWISNIVPVYKKNGKMRVYIDFGDLNRATPMDGYPCLLLTCWLMLLLDIKLLASWMAMQGTIRFFMAVEDVAKTAFRCPGHIGLFEWIVMIFGLKMLVQLIREP